MSPIEPSFLNDPSFTHNSCLGFFSIGLNHESSLKRVADELRRGKNLWSGHLLASLAKPSWRLIKCMTKGHHVKAPLNQIGSVVLIRVNSEVDRTAKSMLIPGGSAGTPLLRAFTASPVGFNEKK